MANCTRCLDIHDRIRAAVYTDRCQSLCADCLDHVSEQQSDRRAELKASGHVDRPKGI